jgi:hypothetical protein
MSKLTYEPIKGYKQNDYAISFCLYKSPNFDANKHIKPFEKFLNDNGQSGYDILLFYGDENDLTPDILNNDKIRLYKVLSEEKNYTRHLWRYLGALEDYRWVWFRGTDTPMIPKREINLQFAAEYSGCDTIIWSRPNISCLGKFCLNRRIGNNFIDYLRNFEISERLAITWDCDEKILSTWVDTGNQKVMLALDGPTLRNPHQEEWAIRRLRHGNHTVIVKDRDDRNLLNK